jgi:AmmeMemoRadiSam system protein A/AmmeMemoRadiSam system protein B
MKTLWEPMMENAETTAGARSSMPVVCAALMPHAPILVPAISGSHGREASASCRAMREAAGRIMSAGPESVVLISPHSPRRSGAFGLWSDESIQGSFEPFGAPEVQVNLPNDRRLASAISAEAHARNVETWLIRRQPLDHGALVPLWFLAEAGWTGPTVVLSLNYPDEGGLTSLGEAIAAAAKTLQRRVGFIASGDMSHRLTANAPCGFHPQAHRFDESFIRLIRGGHYRSLQNLDQDLRELAAEDAVDSTLVAAAAVGWSSAGHEVLNYEGPFGVGYGVAILFAGDAAPEQNPLQNAAGNVLPDIARQSVEAALRGSSATPPAAAGDYLSGARGVFVTLRQRDGKLRGCIGTIVPACDNLVQETWRNARLAAFNDNRFPPVGPGELLDLRFEVSVMHEPEKISSCAELDPTRFGVIVSTADGRRGLLLPDLDGLDTIEKQLQLARRKGAIDPEESVDISRFEVDCFEED